MEEDEGEYEIVPASPLKRIEQRLARVEQSAGPSEVRKLIEEIVEMIKSNQRVLDDTLRANAELRDEVAKLPTRMDTMITHLMEFVDMLKAAGEGGEEQKPLIDPQVFAGSEAKLAELVELNRKNLDVGQAVLASLSVIDKRLKRTYIELAAARQPEQQLPGEPL